MAAPTTSVGTTFQTLSGAERELKRRAGQRVAEITIAHGLALALGLTLNPKATRRVLAI